MATYNAVNVAGANQHMAEMGNAVIYDDRVVISSALQNGDKVRLVRVPAGTRVTDLAIVNPDLDTGTTLQAKLGWEYVDGSSGGVDNNFAAAGALWQTAAKNRYLPDAPFVADKDIYIIATVTANATTNTGTIYTTVTGIGVGVK